MADENTHNPRFHPKDRTASKPQEGEQRFYVSSSHMPIPVLMLDDMGLGEWDLGHCKERRRQWVERLLTAEEVTEWLANYLAHAEFRLAEEVREWSGRRDAVKAVMEKWGAERDVSANAPSDRDHSGPSGIAHETDYQGDTVWPESTSNG